MKQAKQNFKAGPIKEGPNLKEVIKVLEGLCTIWNKCKCPKTKQPKCPQTGQQIKKLIRIILYFVSESRQANYISKKARILWGKHTKGTDLYNLTVPKQRSNKKNYPFLKDIILEHCNPLSIVVDNILYNQDRIKNILEKELITAWITKDENNKLNKDYKSTRPDGWKKCYKEVGIEIE